MTTIARSKVKEITGEPNGEIADTAIFYTVFLIVLALILSFLTIHWFAPGDFGYSAAMHYHGVMVPVLILMYLLAQKMFDLGIPSERLYTAGAILAIILVGTGSIFNNSKGISLAAVVQITGLFITDCLGVILLASMALYALKKEEKTKKPDMAFWLLFASISAILMAASLGHLAGWCLDLGTRSIPGLNALLETTNMNPKGFQSDLVTSHSHLIVAALLSGLAALTARCFWYQSNTGWKKRVCNLGLGVTLIALLSATAIYTICAITGWNPPVLFTSGPSGIPLDDLVLTTGEGGILITMAGLFLSPAPTGIKSSRTIKGTIKIAVSLNWVLGFAGAVLLGIYIELHEGFYGTGLPPAPGAINDSIFIRAHLLYAFFLLPTILAVSLALGIKYNHARARGLWPMLFVWTSILGMVLGLAGELIWFVTKADSIFIIGMSVMIISLVAGMISMWRYGIKNPGEADHEGIQP